MAGGRPSVYDSKIEPNLKAIAILKENGMSHDDISVVLGIGRSTYYKHLARIDEFVDATKNGDIELLKNGKLSLAKMVKGYTRKKITKNYRIERGEKILVSELHIEEEIGPEPSSVYFTLVNKSNGEFRHKQEIEHKHDEESMKKVQSFNEKLTELMRERKNESTD